MILGLFFICLGGYFITIALASKTWDQVEGKIINIRVAASLSNSGSARTKTFSL